MIIRKTAPYFDPLRVLVAGDTHGNGEHISYLISCASQNNCDAIFVLGDFGAWEHEPEGVEFLDFVEREASDAHLNMFFLAGNHDNMRHLLNRYAPAQYHDLDRYPDITTVLYDDFVTVRDHIFFAPHGLSWQWYSTRFTSIGGAYSIDKLWRLDQEKRTKKPGSLWFPEEEITDEHLETILRSFGEAAGQSKLWPDVVLAHDKPMNVHIDGWNRTNIPETHHNQRRMQKVIEQLGPRYYLHGHLHWPYRYQLERHTRKGTSYTVVVGLDSDPDGHSPRERKVYDPAKSWTIFNTAERSLRN